MLLKKIFQYSLKSLFILGLQNIFGSGVAKLACEQKRIENIGGSCSEEHRKLTKLGPWLNSENV